MIEAKKKKSEGDDEATPTDPNKKWPSRASSERAKKRLKLVVTYMVMCPNYSNSFIKIIVGPLRDNLTHRPCSYTVFTLASYHTLARFGMTCLGYHYSIRQYKHSLN